MKFYIIVIFSALLVSCTKYSLLKDYRQLKSESISIPQFEHVVNNGRDSVLHEDFKKAKLKFIVLCDSTNCNKCFIESIYGWQDITKLADSLQNQLSIYFIFCPRKSDINEIHNSLLKAKFQYPTILDQEGAFQTYNPHIPQNELLHYFLIDEEGTVIMIGNPISNIQTNNLFKKTVEEYLKR